VRVEKGRGLIFLGGVGGCGMGWVGFLKDQKNDEGERGEGVGGVVVVGVVVRVLDLLDEVEVEEWEEEEEGTCWPGGASVITPWRTPYVLTRSSNLDRGWLRSNRSLNMSSLSRWSSDSSTKTSSLTLSAMKRSRMGVSRWIVWSGEVGVEMEVGGEGDVLGNGSEEYGGRMRDW
jgi:hypothetical protein